MADKLILIGGGGHCKACIDVIESSGKYEIAGVLDSIKSKEDTVLRYKVIGDDSILNQFGGSHLFLVTVGHMKDVTIRVKLYSEIKSNGARLATVYSPLSHISKYSTIGEGSIVMHFACVNADARIGINCIINNKALVEHDSMIGDHCHISTGAIINGNCKVGNGVFIGSNTVLVQGISIAPGAFVAAGSVVRKNIDEPGLYAGNPARKMK